LWYHHLMETFVLLILGLLALVAVVLLVVYPAMLLAGMSWQVVAGFVRGLTARTPAS